MFELPSIGHPMSILSENVLVSVIMFLVLFFGIAFLFARDRFVPMLLGFLRTAASLFTSPFFYFRKLVLDMANSSKQPEDELLKSDQYLINKLLVALRAVLIVAALAGMAVCIVGGWQAFMPPKELREAMTSTENDLATARAELAKYDASVTQMENDWQSKRTSLITQYRSERQQKIDAATKENQGIENAIASDATAYRALQSVKGYLSGYEGRSAYMLDQARDTVHQFLQRLSVSEGAMQQLSKYAENWRTINAGKLEMDSLSEDQLRAQVQPNYSSEKSSLVTSRSKVAMLEDRLQSLGAMLKYHPEYLAGGILLGIIYFLYVTWAVGLLIEAIAIGVCMAGDVRKLRALEEEKESKAAAVVAGA